ncbi:MAG: DUF928 domain-containing protein [Cyanobacteria bacterium J06639_14]
MNSDLLMKSASITLLVSGFLAMALVPVMAVSFTPPPDNTAPQQGSGGASRGTFTPPTDNTAPRQASGGASRIEFTPPSDNAAPRTASGGASRDGFNFIPPPDNAAPRTASGGASRDGLFTPPNDNPAPTTASGGASRANQYGTSSFLFQTDAESMLALTPDSFYGQTLAARPMILAYVPESTAQQAVFRLKDEEQNLIYQQTVTLPEQGGIVAVQIPETAPALAIDQNYQWFLTLQVEAQITPASPFVDAWIKRIEPDQALAAILATAAPLEASEVLAQNGIWYDTVATLAELQMTTPDENITEHWIELLASVGLTQIIEAPVVAVREE